MNSEWDVTFGTVLCADSVEYDARSGTLAVGTYQLDQESGEKSGRVHLFNESLNDLCATVDSDAVLDMKWTPSSEHLIIATNKSHLGFLATDSAEIAYPNVSSSEVLLSLAVSSEHIYASTNRGSVHVCDPSDGRVVEQFKAHDLEVWTVASCGESIFTGADDGLFKQWDRRVDSATEIFVSKAHGAGVCTIAVNPHNNVLLATGSYDKTLRLWDTRALQKPMIEQFYAASGVWRVKWSPVRENVILAACMHDGYYVVDCGALPFQVLDRRPTSSLAYGCAWGPGDKIFGCSFYNRQAQEWTLKA